MPVSRGVGSTQLFQFPTVFKPAGKETKVGNDYYNCCRPFFVFSPMFLRVERVLPTWWELSVECLFLITQSRRKTLWATKSLTLLSL